MNDKICATTIYSIMNTDGWKEFENYIEERCNFLQERLINGESGIEIGSVEVKDEKITIIPLIKDNLQQEIQVLRKLKKRFQEWRKIAKEGIKHG